MPDVMFDPLLTLLKICWCIVGTFLEVFGIEHRTESDNVQKRSCGLRKGFGESSEISGKWSEIFGKSRKDEVNYCTCDLGITIR